jgi:predicted  nucleic acid-binding Zn-ribbon protein
MSSPSKPPITTSPPRSRLEEELPKEKQAHGSTRQDLDDIKKLREAAEQDAKREITDAEKEVQDLKDRVSGAEKKKISLEQEVQQLKAERRAKNTPSTFGCRGK